MNEPSDMERSRLLLGWLAARRAVDHCLSDLLAAGPAGERRVRESLAMVDDLETRAQVAFHRYRSAAGTTERATTGGDRAPADDPVAAGAGGAVEDGVLEGHGHTAAAGGTDPRVFEVDARNVMPLHLDTRGVGTAGREPGNVDPRTVEPLAVEPRAVEPRASERWPTPRERPRLNVVRAAEADLASSSTNTKSNQRHR